MQSGRLQSGLIGSILIHSAILSLLYFANLDAKPQPPTIIPITVSLMEVPEVKTEPQPQKKPQSKKIEPKKQKEVVQTPIKKELEVPTKEDTSTVKAPAKQTETVQNSQKQEQKSNPVKTENDEIKKYLANIRKRLQNNLEYPYFAKKAGIEGVVNLHFCIRQDGSLSMQSVKIIKSSGYGALDKQAIETLQSSAPFTAPPNGEMEVSIPVSFSIKS